MLNINKIKLANVGRFQGEHEIDLASLPKLLQIDGKNMNTGGSSGSGKSTIFLALEYALGINDAAATQLQCRQVKAAMSVTLECDVDGKPLTITRHKSNGLTVINDGHEVSGSSKMAEEALDKAIGIPRNLLRPMIHKRQGEGGFFLSLTAQKCHSFLMECLQQKDLEKRIESAEKDAAKLEESYKAKQLSLNERTISLNTLKTNRDNLTEPQKTVAADVLVGLEANLVRAQDELTLKEADKTRQLSELVPPAPVATQDDPTLVAAVTTIEADISSVSKVLSDLEAAESARKAGKQAEVTKVQAQIAQVRSNLVSTKAAAINLTRLLKEGGEITGELTHLNEAKCPTCKQLIQNGTHAEIAAKLNTRLSVIQADILKCQEAAAQVPGIEAQLPPLEEQVKQLNLEIIQPNEKISKCKNFLEMKRAALKEANAAVSAHRNAQQAGYQQAVQDYNAAHKKITVACDYAIYDARMLVDKIQSSISVHKARAQQEEEAAKNYLQYRSMLDEQINNAEVLLNALSAEVDQLRTKALVASEAARFVKSYSNQLFQDSLAVVAENATRFLSRIPNMATASVSFDSVRETQKGALREEVNPILSLDNEVGIPVKSISGGERAAADLAIDRGVIEMIEARTGKGVNLFALDEPFDGLDSICRENCLEVLKASVSGKRIVIVDHSNETKQLVPDKIVVVREGLKSSVRIG